jgi:ketosteroid isomerase-like protein
MSATDEVLTAERNWLAALQEHNLRALEKVLADDFTLTPWASSGEIISKQEYLEDAKRIHISSAEVRSCRTQIYGDTAIVKCHLTWTAEYSGLTWAADFLITDVWLKSDNAWRAVTRHVSTPKSPQAMARPESRDSAEASASLPSSRSSGTQ